MTSRVSGNTKGLTSSETRLCEKLLKRRIEKEEIVPLDLAREMYAVAQKLSRRIGLLVTREGNIEEVVLGRKDILYLPDLGRYRFGRGRLRRMRLIFTDLSKDASRAHIPQDIYTDLEKLRLDMVVSVRADGPRVMTSFAHLLAGARATGVAFHTEELRDLSRGQPDFQELMEALEQELELDNKRPAAGGPQRALLVSVSDSSEREIESSLDELAELARTAGVAVAGRVTQRRRPDPRTLLGAGKLEEVVLTCLRLEAELLIFDTELKPTQWRSVTNAAELKILDRSMLILDIFAQRATSSDGRLQVELAQLKYNLPRLTEMDAGLSRLTGGIGGRGPGETKLEVSRRVARDRISSLERKIEELKGQRQLKKKRRLERAIPGVAIVGYTNVGKSTLFNLITKSDVIAENKLFATLDPAKRRMVLPRETGTVELIVSDTVGFIRHLPDELMNAFRATLEEIGDAELIVHLLDASDPEIEKRKEAVEEILADMGFGSIPSILVLNKIDRTGPETLERLRGEYDGIFISAAARTNVKALLDEIASRLEITAADRASSREQKHPPVR